MEALALNIAALLLAALLIPLLARPCAVVVEETDAVRLEFFTVGVSRHARRRYQIKDIKVGDVSVRHLFEEPHRKDPGWWPAGYFRWEKITLFIRSGEDTPKHLEELKRILIAHPDRPLQVVLRDEMPVWNRGSGWACGGPYEYSISIPVKFETTPCDRVTRVIYEKIISKVIKEDDEGYSTKEGQADRRLDINEVFDRLRDDRAIEEYLDSLGAVTEDPCVETIKALKERREEKADRFGRGQYELRKDIQDGLRLIINAAAIDPGWWKSSLSVKVTGFTDKLEVDATKGKQLEMSQTGISADVWSKLENPFEVYFSGCQHNKVEDEPVYLSFIAGKGGQLVGYRIDNNCELGAVRAYVAMVYLTNHLGRISDNDVYATGGIYSGPDASAETQDDPQKRRVHVEFIIRAAKVN